MMPKTLNYSHNNSSVMSMILGTMHSEKGVISIEYAIVLAGVAALVAIMADDGGPIPTLLTNVFIKVASSVDATFSSL